MAKKRQKMVQVRAVFLMKWMAYSIKEAIKPTGKQPIHVSDGVVTEAFAKTLKNTAGARYEVFA